MTVNTQIVVQNKTEVASKTPVLKVANVGPVSHVERNLGETEASYYLPSREDGVNDMCVFFWPSLGRVLSVIGIFISASTHHPSRLLAAGFFLLGLFFVFSTLCCPPESRCTTTTIFDSCKLAHDLVPSLLPHIDLHFFLNLVTSVLNASRTYFTRPSKTWNSVHRQKTVGHFDLLTAPGTNRYEYIELIDSYLNGERTLSNNRLSYLVLSSRPASGSAEQTFDLLICATHYVGDGMALHTFANQFLGLLGGPLTENELMSRLDQEYNNRKSV